MRPRQWAKSIFIFAPLVFDKKVFIPDLFLRTLAGFVLFCLISSSVYIFNDLADIEADREHPQKKNRPIASGRLPPANGLGRGHLAASHLRDGRLSAGAILCDCAGRLFPPQPGLLQVAQARLDPGRAHLGRGLCPARRSRRHVDPCRTVFTLAVRRDDAALAVPGIWQTARRTRPARGRGRFAPQSAGRATRYRCSINTS